MTALVVMVVTIMTLLVLGYSFNQDDGKIEQGGLLQLGSSPTGARVTLDGRELGSRTNTKSTVTAKEHEVYYDLDGYQRWSKNITIQPGQVGWLNYARMIPRNLTVEPVRVLPTVADTLVSPKKSFIAVQADQKKPSLQFFDMRSESPDSDTIIIPESSYIASKKSSFELVGWSSSEEVVLVKHVYDDGMEWILVDRDEPEKSVNLNDLFDITPTAVEFAGGSDEKLFVQVGDEVSRVNVREQRSRVLATNVDSFSVFNEDTIVYVALANEIGTRIIGYSSVDFSSQQIIRAYPDVEGVPLAAMANYFNRKYIAIIHEDQLIVDSGDFATPSAGPDLRRIVLRDIPAGANALNFSRNGRFVTIEYDDRYIVYDLELRQYSETAWVDKSKNPRDLQWLDDYIVWSDYGDQLRIYDFDGANQHLIMKSTEGYSAMLANDGKYIYGWLDTDEGVELRRVKIQL